MLQLIPVPEGRGSLRVAAVAVPMPVFVAVSVYPMEEPASIVAASAVFERFRLGHWTVVVADACTVLLFIAESEAVFGYAAQLEDEVALVTCTVAVPFAARFPKLQLSSWLAIEHVPGPL
jgi:hypothetical protein